MNIGFYAILPATVRYDRKLRALAKLTYAEVAASMDFRRESDVNLRYLSRLLGVSKITVSQYLRELVAGGHLDKIKREGRLVYAMPTETVYIKHEEEVTVTEQEAKERSKDINEILKHWNSIFKDRLGYGVKRTTEVVGELTERLESFTKEDIMTALQNRHDFVRQSAWHNESSRVHLMSNIHTVILTDEDLIKNLNMVIAKPISIDMKKETIEFKTGDHDKEALK